MVDFSNFSLQSQLPPGGPIQAPAPMQLAPAAPVQQAMPFGLLGALLSPKANKKNQAKINASSVGDRPVASINRRPDEIQQLVSMFNTAVPTPPPQVDTTQMQPPWLPFPLSLFSLFGGR